MQIIHLVLGKANPERMNGVNKLVCEMANTQSELGYDVSLWGITPNPVHDYPERHFKTVLFQSLSNKTTIHSSLKKEISKLSEKTVFHLHGSFIPEFYHIGKLLQKRDIPYLYTPHGALAPAALKRNSLKKNIYFKFFEKLLIEGAATVVATGKSVYDNLGNLVQNSSKKLIPNGQPLIDVESPVYNRNEKIIFSFCGRIALEHKGLDLLLTGFRKFLDKGGEAGLQIIGDGEELPVLKMQVAQLNLEEHIRFHGARFGNEKFQLLRKSHVFVHTSRMEGFPASVLEAAAIGLPCLVSTHTNMGDYIKSFDAGLVLEENTPVNIAYRMMELQILFENGLLEEKGNNAKQMIATEFDWKNICKLLITTYENATSNTLDLAQFQVQ